MIIRYFSDIHLELLHMHKINVKSIIDKIKPNKEHICILAGDIGDPYSKNYNIFMNHINTSFKKTFVIAGNHEYYNNFKTIEETNEYLTKYFKDNNLNNISFLNNTFEHYEDSCFIGTTLWSNINDPKYKINDVYSIKDLDIEKYNTLNKTSRVFLKNVINTTDTNNNIIITHHIPTELLIHPKYLTPKMKPYNQWFYSNMEIFINENGKKIKCWLYGHTHTPSNCIINNTRFICNPIGYIDENDYQDYDKTIEL
jgi:predicted MPP superfamily phosphohydrolase